MSHLGFISVDHYEELERQTTKIFPSTTRGGNELPSSSALDSPSAMHDTYDETTSVCDTTLPLGEFLDEQLARVRGNEITEDPIIDD